MQRALASGEFFEPAASCRPRSATSSASARSEAGQAAKPRYDGCVPRGGTPCEVCAVGMRSSNGRNERGQSSAGPRPPLAFPVVRPAHDANSMASAPRRPLEKSATGRAADVRVRHALGAVRLAQRQTAATSATRRGRWPRLPRLHGELSTPMAGARRRDGRNGRAAWRGRRRAGEPARVHSGARDAAQRALGGVVAEEDASVVEQAGERRLPGQHIADRLGGIVLWRQPVELLAHIALECGDEGITESTATGTPTGKPSPNPAPLSPMTTLPNHSAAPPHCIALDSSRAHAGMLTRANMSGSGDLHLSAVRGNRDEMDERRRRGQ